jgi:hypothetical protein
MTTAGGAVPTQQACPGCGALVYYEGHSELRTANFVPHRFHCHACGRLYIVRSTSHKPPRFALSPRHEVAVAAGEADAGHGDEPTHDHDQEERG